MNIFLRLWEILVPRTRSYEQAVIEALCKELVPAEADKVAKQMRLISFIERSASGDVVEFYRRGGKRAKSQKCLLLALDSESILGVVVLLGKSSNDHCISATVWQVNGALFSIHFSENPTSLAKRCHVLKVEVAAGRPQQPVTRPTPILDRISSRLPVCEIKPPQAENVLKLGIFPSGVPSDFMQLVTEADGFLAGGWQFLGSRLIEVPTDAGVLCLIASNQTRSRFIGLKSCNTVEPVIELLEVDGAGGVETIRETSDLAEAFIWDAV